MYLLKHLIGGFTGHVDRYRNVFGYKVMQLRLEGGTDGESRKALYVISKKKLYAGRYSTDCLKGLYVDKLRTCRRSLADLPTYRDIVAEPDELKEQNSYFVNDVMKYK